MNDIKGLLNEVSKEGMLDRIKYMTENFPYRLAGSETEHRASIYVTEVMRDYGLEVENLEFNTYNSNPITSSVKILMPEEYEIDSIPCGHIRTTGEEGVDIEVVYVGSGGEKDYADIDVTGKMVLVEVSYAPPVPEKARIAASKGAIGIMAMNWGNDEEVICHRAIKSVWGNPTPENFDEIPDLIGVGITRGAGLRLKETLQSGKKVIAHVVAIADRTWSKVHQPHGIIRGNGKSKEFMLIASHLDAWEPGVTCNATGNATALELCRILSAHRNELNRDVHFVFWNGHEIAEAAGSTWFLDHNWDEINKNCIAYMHIDSTGVRDTKLLEIKIGDELYAFARNNVSYLSDEDLRLMTLKKIGDMSYMGIGVPGICQRISFTDEDIKAAHGATLGWWNHTIEDGVDKCDPDILYKDTCIHLEFIYNLLNSDILPYDFSKNFELIDANLLPLMERYKSHLNFRDLEKEYLEAKENVLGIQKTAKALFDSEGTERESISDYNDFLKICSRSLSNIFKTYASKYEQDRYGHSNLSSPVPLLADLPRLDEFDKDSLEYGLYETLLVRNMNRIIDGLQALNKFAELYRRILFQ